MCIGEKVKDSTHLVDDQGGADALLAPQASHGGVLNATSSCLVASVWAECVGQLLQRPAIRLWGMVMDR